MATGNVPSVDLVGLSITGRDGKTVLGFRRTAQTEGRDYVVEINPEGYWEDRSGNRVSLHSANVGSKTWWESRWVVGKLSDIVDRAFAQQLGLRTWKDGAA